MKTYTVITTSGTELNADSNSKYVFKSF